MKKLLTLIAFLVATSAYAWTATRELQISSNTSASTIAITNNSMYVWQPVYFYGCMKPSTLTQTLDLALSNPGCLWEYAYVITNVWTVDLDLPPIVPGGVLQFGDNGSTDTTNQYIFIYEILD